MINRVSSFFLQKVATKFENLNIETIYFAQADLKPLLVSFDKNNHDAAQIVMTNSDSFGSPRMILSHSRVVNESVQLISFSRISCVILT